MEKCQFLLAAHTFTHQCSSFSLPSCSQWASPDCYSQWASPDCPSASGCNVQCLQIGALVNTSARTLKQAYIGALRSETLRSTVGFIVSCRWGWGVGWGWGVTLMRGSQVPSMKGVLRSNSLITGTLLPGGRLVGPPEVSKPSR